MRSTLQLLAAIALLIGMNVLPGCGAADASKPASAPPAADSAAHDPDDVPITEADVELPAHFGEAVARIKSYRDTIRSAVEAGSPGKAHRPLDELDIVLDKLPAIARDGGVPKEQWETINTTAQDLRDRFNEIHSAIDEKRPPDYGAVADPIEKAISQLEDLSTAQ